MLAQFRYRRAERSARIGRLAAAHRDFARAARAGHAAAQYRVASNYSAGRGCVRSGSEAIRWYEKAAEAGHTDAQFELGVLLLADRDAAWCAGPSARWAAAVAERGSSLPNLAFPKGATSQKDNERAVYWLSEAAEGGKPEAQANLGWLRLKGIGCAADRAEALRWLTASAAHDISQAAFGLAEYYGASDQPEYDPTASREWLRRAADLGNASAAFNFARALMLEPEAEPSLAERYLAIAAEKNHVEAAYELAFLQLEGAQPDAEFDQILERLRTAAKANHAKAAYLLGEIYSRGDRIRPDLREAASWMQQAADNGHVQAQFQLGCFYARGEGVPRDLVHAARYFEASASGGHLIGALNTGIFYEEGQGVTRDLGRAIDWLRVASDGGVPQAQARLGRLLAGGAAGFQDETSARDWLERAAQQDSVDAQVMLAQMLLDKGDPADAQRATGILVGLAKQDHFIGAKLILIYQHRLTDGAASVPIAIEALERSAERGHVEGMVALGIELMSGENSERDALRAERMFRQASALGSVEALFQLGVVYCQRNQQPEDIATGLQFYMEAANACHPLAQYNAGVMLLNGVGTAADPEMAYALFENAAAQGLQQARALKDRLDAVFKA